MDCHCEPDTGGGRRGNLLLGLVIENQRLLLVEAIPSGRDTGIPSTHSHTHTPRVGERQQSLPWTCHCETSVFLLVEAIPLLGHPERL
jgi:hypothetical protein